MNRIPRALIVAALLMSGMSASADDAPLPDGWTRDVPIPNALLGEGDRYVVWVEGGWLCARRETAAREVDWQVVLARATDPTPPIITSPPGSFRFEVSYRGGRYFVREDANLLRCLRERKTADGTGPPIPFDRTKYTAGSGSPACGLWTRDGWDYAATLPRPGAPDGLVRLTPGELPGGSGCEVVKESTVVKLTRGECWAIDDGELLIAQRVIAALYRSQLKVGGDAPDFTADTLDGAKFRLADQRGKVVLLDFWATWCGPCVAEMPHLKAIHDAHAKNAKFALASLSLDDDPALPRKFLRDKPYSWTQLHLPDGPADAVARDYGATSIPLTVLVGPDGKILALGLRGRELEDRVDRALAQP